MLEVWLSRQRARKAEQLLPAELREGRILDVGCGSFPQFLTRTRFKEKYAIDQLPAAVPADEIAWYVMDLNASPKLPFADGFLSAVTLLAVAEHIHPDSLTAILREAHRTLRPGGRVVLTTPTARADGLLKLMARLGLVSAEEINEHVYGYSLPLLGWQLGRAGFDMARVHFGTFELGLNLWAMAER